MSALPTEPVQTPGFGGPLAPPEALLQYDALLPAAAQRKSGMVERQAAHRRAMERHAARVELRGQALGLILALTAILGGLILIAAAQI